MTVGILGLGLIGGSLARAYKLAGHTVYVKNRDESMLAFAMLSGAVDGKLDEADREAFRKGLVLGDGTRCLPAALELLGEGECLVTVMEGKYHQVKRMLASRGAPVLELRRLSIGGLALGETLSPGGWRELDAADIEKLFGQDALEN